MTPNACAKSRRLYNFSAMFIYSNNKKSPKNSFVCNRMANMLITDSIQFILLICLSVVIGTCAPMYKLLFTNEREMILPVIFPFIDPDTEHGFYINLASQYFSCLSGFVILPGCELILCATKHNFTSYAAVVENDILEFGMELEHDGEFSQKQILQFRNIIIKILDFSR